MQCGFFKRKQKWKTEEEREQLDEGAPGNGGGAPDTTNGGAGNGEPTKPQEGN